MAQWEYCKADLGAVSRSATDVGLLNNLGNEGWELVSIMPNGIAYFKRQLPPSAPPKSARRTKPVAAETEQD